MLIFSSAQNIIISGHARKFVIHFLDNTFFLLDLAANSIENL